MFELIELWSTLSYSKIEGLDSINAAFRTLLGQIKKKPYDVLNTRKTEFDTDFVGFKRDLADLRVRLQEFLDKKFEEIPSCARALALLAKFEKIKALGLDLSEKYDRIFTVFGDELDEIRKMYNHEKNDPPVPRNLPPISVSIRDFIKMLMRLTL